MAASSGSLLSGDTMLAGLLIVGLLYVMAPQSKESVVVAAPAALRAAAAESAGAISRTSATTAVSASSSEANGDDADADSDGADDTERADDNAADASADDETEPAYPKYEGDASSSDAMVSAADEPGESEDSAGDAEPDPETSTSSDEETSGDAYDEKQDGVLFEDQDAFNAAPIIKVLPEARNRQYSKIVLAHERYHRTHPSRLYVPRLRADARLTVEQFRKLFMEPSQPVIVPFEAMRHLNFTSKGYTLDQMQELFPNQKKSLYKYGAIMSKQIDLGPAIAALREDKNLRKTTVGKSYPRNTKIRLESLGPLDQQRPALIPDIPMMLPSLWFGPTSAATPLHSDCCDNWAVMIAGTKRWTVAPPAEARLLKPNCQGGLCWVKALVHADEHATTPAEKRLRDSVQFVTFDLHGGDMLYLPAGWFHHVENVGGTVMVNHWSKAGPEFLRHYDALVAAKKKA